jgi:hypothetical protein
MQFIGVDKIFFTCTGGGHETELRAGSLISLAWASYFFKGGPTSFITEEVHSHTPQ